MKAETVVRRCDFCGTQYVGLLHILTEEEAKAHVEASRKAHARTKAGRNCPTQIKHRKKSCN